jgi:hypothetical protein
MQDLAISGIRYEVGFFGYCSFSALVPFVLLGVCFTTLSIYCVITIVRKFGVIWIYRSCFINTFIILAVGISNLNFD